MKSLEIEIINKLGLHARAAAKFVSTANSYASEIFLANENNEVNGKSIMSVMMLAAGQGTTLKLSARGDDEEEALTALSFLIQNRFGEEE